MILFHVKIDDDDDDDVASILIQIDTLRLVITVKFLQGNFAPDSPFLPLWHFWTHLSASQVNLHKIHCNPKVICTARIGFCSSKRIFYYFLFKMSSLANQPVLAVCPFQGTTGQ